MKLFISDEILFSYKNKYFIIRRYYFEIYKLFSDYKCPRCNIPYHESKINKYCSKMEQYQESNYKFGIKYVSLFKVNV